MSMAEFQSHGPTWLAQPPLRDDEALERVTKPDLVRAYNMALHKALALGAVSSDAATGLVDGVGPRHLTTTWDKRPKSDIVDLVRRAIARGIEVPAPLRCNYDAVPRLAAGTMLTGTRGYATTDRFNQRLFAEVSRAKKNVVVMRGVPHVKLCIFHEEVVEVVPSSHGSTTTYRLTAQHDTTEHLAKWVPCYDNADNTEDDAEDEGFSLVSSWGKHEHCTWRAWAGPHPATPNAAAHTWTSFSSCMD
jgi:hypothetical protein